MVETDEQTFTLYGPGLPGPDRCTFLDEFWRTRTVRAKRSGSHEEDVPLSSMPPFSEAPWITAYTVVQRAYKEDKEIWDSSASLDDYEQKRQALYDKRRSERDAWMRKQPLFPKFPSLPNELRQWIWTLASEDHTTRVLIAVAKYYEIPVREDCGGGTTPSSSPLEVTATAYLPPLMLVNSEAHGIASKFYRRAFRALDGRGGVLAAYPTVLTIDRGAFQLFSLNDLELVTEIALTHVDHWCMSPSVCDKLEILLLASNLKRFVAKLIMKSAKLEGFCRKIRGVLTSERSSARKRGMPEIVLEVKDTRKDGYELYFQGGPFDIPKTNELLWNTSFRSQQRVQNASRGIRGSGYFCYMYFQ